MNPIKDLVNEHSLIRMMLAVLKGMDERIVRDKEVPTGDLENAIFFLREFADKCHHGKEERFLFPMIRKNGVREEAELIDILLEEHVEGREYVKKMAEVIDTRSGSEEEFARGFIANSQKYAVLLDRHIATEDGILFSQAERYLSEREMEELEKGFERLETEEIGIGRHEELHEMLRKLKEAYA